MHTRAWIGSLFVAAMVACPGWAFADEASEESRHGRHIWVQQAFRKALPGGTYGPWLERPHSSMPSQMPSQMPMVWPDPNIDYEIRTVRPRPDIDYKIKIVKPFVRQRMLPVPVDELTEKLSELVHASVDSVLADTTIAVWPALPSSPLPDTLGTPILSR